MTSNKPEAKPPPPAGDTLSWPQSVPELGMPISEMFCREGKNEGQENNDGLRELARDQGSLGNMNSTNTRDQL